MTVQPVGFSILPVQLLTTAATLYTVAANPANILLVGGRLRFANQDTATRAVTAYAVPSGGAATVTTAFMNAVTIAANQYLDVDLPVLAAGGSYQALADVGGKVSVFQLGGVALS